jgi:hypothetical protein
MTDNDVVATFIITLGVMFVATLIMLYVLGRGDTE